MSEQSKHTPTPWQVLPDPRGRLVHVETSPDNPHGAGLPVCSIPTRREGDADFIVAACNARDDLLEACRWLVNVAHDEGRAGGRPEPGEWEAAVEAGMAAIVKAEGDV